MIGADEIFAAIARDVRTDSPGGAIDVCALARAWLAHGASAIREDPPADTLDALCRQIDVRRTVAPSYDLVWRPQDPEHVAPQAVIAAVVAALLAAADGVDATGACGDGVALKWVNSALKALDLWPALPCSPQLRAWAMRRLDTHPVGTADA